jgi:hypothetical protein
MRGLGTFIGGGLIIAALIAGWWAIYRVQEHLPSPVNAVIDSVQNAGSPNGGPLIQPLPQGEQAPPLDACPEFRDDVTLAEDAIAAAAPDAQARAEANNALINRELTRIADGGAAVPLATSGAAGALGDQATVLREMAAGLRGTTFQTPEAESLATGVAAAADRVATANDRFVAQAAGTPAQWRQWAGAVSGPLQQVEVAVRGFGKCPA